MVLPIVKVNLCSTRKQTTITFSLSQMYIIMYTESVTNLSNSCLVSFSTVIWSNCSLVQYVAHALQTSIIFFVTNFIVVECRALYCGVS